MSAERREKKDREDGRFIVIASALLMLACVGILAGFVLPATKGFFSFLAWNGIAFFLGGFFMFLANFQSPQPVERFITSEGVYAFCRPLWVRMLGAIVGAYSLLIVPIIALICAVTLPLMFVADPSALFPVLSRFDLFSIYQTWETLSGSPLLIALLFLFPWLYSSLIRMWCKSLPTIFGPNGVRLDGHGLTVFGSERVFVPWLLVERAAVAVHGYRDVVVLWVMNL